MKLFYYKRLTGSWVFPDGVFTDEREALKHLISKRKAGLTVWRLYLDIPEDFELIKANFFTPDYWSNTTWEKEANNE